ncbi:MAG TPA: general secretion pathway protein GspB [Humisphaera sp.]
MSSFIPGQDQSAGTEPSESSDLNDALGQGESTFVTSDGGEAKKKVSGGTVALFGMLAACAAGTYFMYARGGPAAAMAAEDDATAAQIETMRADGQKHAALMRQVLKDAPQVVQRFQEASANTQVPLKELGRNPFRMRAEVAAAAPDPTADRRRREEERAAAATAAEALKIQTIVYGTRRMAMVNGKALREGDTIDGFAVEQIRPDSVVVRNGPYGFVLWMQK